MATEQAAAIREEEEFAKLNKLVAKLAPDVPDRMSEWPTHSQDPKLLMGDRIAWINRFLGQILRDQTGDTSDDNDEDQAKEEATDVTVETTDAAEADSKPDESEPVVTEAIDSEPIESSTTRRKTR
jgi:hypothetical protein